MNRTFIQTKVLSVDTSFATAIEALEAAAAFDATTRSTFQYEIEAQIVYDGQDRNVNGFRVRIKDIDGFGRGYVGLLVEKNTGHYEVGSIAQLDAWRGTRKLGKTPARAISSARPPDDA